MLDNTACIFTLISQDSSCLFGAIAHQLFDFALGSSMYSAMTMTLREMVVRHIYRHANVTSATFLSLIELRVQDEFLELIETNLDTMVSTFSVFSRFIMYGVPQNRS